jgi:hypothetical protein
MIRMLTIKPKSALILYLILPFCIMSLSLIGAILYDSLLLFVIFFSIAIFYILFFILWRFLLGWVTFKISSKIENRQNAYRLFVIFYMSMIIIIPLIIAIIINIGGSPQIVLGYLILIMLYGFISNYFQCTFIAKNLSLIKYHKKISKELGPINWTTIAYYPFMIIKTQKILIELLN